MAAKSANINVRVEPEIKEQAEEILDRLGISTAAFINMTFRQVILKKGIPFSITLSEEPVTRDAMTDRQFAEMMQTGLKQAKEGDTIACDDAFDQLLGEL